MSSKITQEKYDLVKIERLKHFLESATEKGRPKFYEVFVDNLKAVDKTSDPEAFDEYLVYMSDDTRMVKVLIYTSTENCPRNDKFIFTVTSPEKERDEKRRQELSGFEIEEKIQSVVQQEREKMNTELLKKELAETQEELEEAETYIEQLEKQLVEAQRLQRAKSCWFFYQPFYGCKTESVHARKDGFVRLLPFTGHWVKTASGKLICEDMHAKDRTKIKSSYIDNQQVVNLTI